MSSAHRAPHTECSSHDDHRDGVDVDDVVDEEEDDDDREDVVEEDDDDGEDDDEGDDEDDGEDDDASDSISSIWPLSALLHTYKHQPAVMLLF